MQVAISRVYRVHVVETGSDEICKNLAFGTIGVSGVAPESALDAFNADLFYGVRPRAKIQHLPVVRHDFHGMLKLSLKINMKTGVVLKHKQALALYPQLRIVEHRPEITQVGDQLFIECSVTVSRDPDDPIPVTAYIFEPYPGKTTFTKNSEQANGATSVLGRALGYMGLGIDKSIASSNEVLGRQQAAEETDRTKVCFGLWSYLVSYG